MGRLLQQLRDMKSLPDSKRVPLSSDSRKDLLWWSTYLREYNGVTAIVNVDDNQMPLDLLLTTSHKVCAVQGMPLYGVEELGMEIATGLNNSQTS